MRTRFRPQNSDSELTPPRWRRFAAAVAAVAVIAAGIVVGAAGPANAWTAYNENSASNGLLKFKATENPITAIGQSFSNTNAFLFQLGASSSALETAFYKGEERGGQNTATYVVNSSGVRASGHTNVTTREFASGATDYSAKGSYGGAGTASNPFFTRLAADGTDSLSRVQYTLTREDSYVLGQPYMKTVFTYTPKVESFQNVAIRIWADCAVKGQDKGFSYADSTSARCYNTKAGTGPVVAVVDGTGSAQAVAGFWSDMRTAAQAYADLPNRCVPYNATNDGCTTSTTTTTIDTGLALGWKRTSLPLNQPTTYTYYTTFGDTLTFADLQTSLTSSANSLAIGDTVTFTVNVKNEGPQSAPNLKGAFVLPAGFQYVSHTTTGGLAYSSPNITAANLAVGASGTVTIVARAVASGSYSLVPTAMSSDAIDNTPCPSYCGTPAQVRVVAPLDATKTTISASPATVTANGSASSLITVTLRDVENNVYTGPATVALTSALGTLTNVTSIGGGQYTASLTSPLAGVTTVGVSVNGTPVAGVGATVTFVAGAPASTTSSFSVSQNTAVANNTDTQTITVTLRDANSNPVLNAGGTIVATIANATVSAFTATATPGVYTATAKSTVAGSRATSVTASGALIPVSGNAQAAWIAGAPVAANSRFDVGTTLVPTSTGRVPITVFLKDANNNPVSGRADVIALNVPGIGTGTLGALTDNGDGSYSSSVSSSLVGSKIAQVRVNGTLVAKVTNDTATFVAGAPAAATSTFTVEAQPTAVGTTRTITIQLKDAGGNLVPGRADAIVVTPVQGLGTGTISAITEVSTGIYAATVRSTLAGAKTIQVSVSGTAVTSTENVATFFAGAASSATSTFDVTADTKTVGNNAHTVTVKLLDLYGNPVSYTDDVVRVSAAGGLGDGTIATASTSTPGVYTATVTSTIAGDKTVSVSLRQPNGSYTGLLWETNNLARFSAGPIDATKSGMTPLSGTRIADGVDAFTVTVTLVDQYNNPIPGAASQLTGTASGSGTFGSFTETSRPGTYTSNVTSVVIGANSLNVMHNGVALTKNPNQSVTFVPGPLASATYSVSTGNAVAGVEHHTITVKLADAKGNPISGRATDLLGSVPVPVDLGAGVISPFAETPTAGTYTATITSTKALTHSVSVTVSGAQVVAAGSTTAAFIAGAPNAGNANTRFDVTTGPADVDGGSHLITVTLADRYGNPVAGKAALLAGTSAQSLGTGRVGAFAESATPGTYTAVVTSTRTGAKTISVTVDGAAITVRDNDKANFSTVGISPADSDFAVTDTTITVGSAHTITVHLRDQFGNAAAGLAASLLASTDDALGASPAGFGTFAETSTPGTYQATVTATTAGEKTIVVRFGAATVPADGNAIARFQAASPDATTSSFTLTNEVRVANGSDQQLLAITLRDTYGNPVYGVDPARLSIVRDATFGVFTAGAITASATDSSVFTASVTSTVANLKAVGVRIDGALIEDTHRLTYFVAGPAAKVTITPLSGTRVADGVDFHLIRATVLDAFNNPVTMEPTRLTAAIEVASATEFTMISPGQYESSITSTVAGTYEATVALDGTRVTTTAPLMAPFVAGAVDLDQSALSVTTDPVVADGEQTHTVTVTLADTHGNPVAGQAALLAQASTSNYGEGTLSGFTETATPGTYTATVTSTVAGGVAITATYKTTKIENGSPATANFIAGPVSLGDSSFVVPSSTQVVGSGSHSVTITLKDRFGNLAPGHQNELAGSVDGGAVLSDITESTTTPGVYTATVTSTVSGEKNVTVTFAGEGVSSTANVARFVPAAPSAAHSTIHEIAGDKIAGVETHEVLVTIRDEFNNPISGAAAFLAGDADATFGTFTETATPGTYSATLATQVAGSVAVHVTLDGETIEDGDGNLARFIAGPADAAHSSIDEIVGTRVANGEASHTVTVRLFDQFDNPVSGAAALLTQGELSLGDGTFATLAETTPGVYTATITSTIAGGKPISVSVDGVPVSNSGEVSAEFVAGPVDFTHAGSGFSVTATDEVVGTGTHTITITLVDAKGNPVPAQAGALIAATTDRLGTGSVSTVSADGSGYSATVTSTISGGKTLTVTYGGQQVTATGNVVANFIAGAPDLRNTAIQTVSGTKIADTVEAHDIVVTVRDSFGNPVPGVAGDLVGAADGIGEGEFSPFTETATGTYTATVTSSLSGGKVVTVTLDGTPIENGAGQSAQFVAGAVNLDDSSYIVSTGTRVAGVETHAVTVTLVDAFGNPVPGKAAALGAASSVELVGGEISGFTEASAGVYVADITTQRAGTVTITTTVDGSDVLAGGNTDAVFVHGAIDFTHENTKLWPFEGVRTADTEDAHQIVVTLADRFGNPVSGAAVTADVHGNGSGTTGAFTEDSAGRYVASLTSSVAGGVTVSAYVGTNLVVDGAAEVANFVAGAVQVADSFFAVSGGDVVVGNEHLITVTLVDQFGNPVPDAADSLQADTEDDLGANGVVSGFVAGSAPGTYTATVRSDIAGGKTIAVTYNGEDLAANTNAVAEFISDGVATDNAGTTFTVSTGDAVVGADQHTITVRLADQYGNPVSGQAAGLSATADHETRTQIGAFEATATPGEYRASISSTLAGAKTITVLFGANPVALAQQGNQTATFIAAAPQAGNPDSKILAVAGTRIADAEDAHTLMVVLVDEFGNPAPGHAAALVGAAEGLGEGEFGSFTETATPGTYTATLTSSVTGSKAVHVELNGTIITAGDGTLAAFVPGPVDRTNAGTSFSVTSGNQVVGTGEHTVTVTLADKFGNAVPGQAALLRPETVAVLGGAGIGAIVETTPGTYTATVRSQQAGAKPITVTYNDATVNLADRANGTANFIAGAVDLADDGSRYAVTTGSVVVGAGSHTITVTLTDTFGNPVPGQSANLLPHTLDALGGGTTTAFTETATPGTYTATVTSERSGSKAMTVTFGGVDVAAGDANTAAVFHAGAVDLTKPDSKIWAIAGERIANAEDAHTVTVTLVDRFGNPAPGHAAALTGAVDGAGDGTFGSFTEGADGTYTASVTSSVAGDRAVHVTFGDAQIENGDGERARFIPGPVDLAHSSFTVTATEVVAGHGTHTITVTLADKYDNPQDVETTALLADTTAVLGGGEISAFTRTAAGVYTATVSSFRSGVKPITVTLGEDDMTAAGNSDARFIAGAPDLTRTNTAILPIEGEKIANTQDAHTITVTVVDEFDNPVPGVADDLLATVPGIGSGTAGRFTETAAGTYTASLTSSVLGDKAVSVTLAGEQIVAGSGTLATFVAGTPDLTRPGTMVVSIEGVRIADGVDQHRVVVMLVDAYDNPVRGAAAWLAATAENLGGGEISAFEEHPVQPGLYYAHITSTLAGDKLVTVTVNGEAIGTPVPARFVEGPVDTENAGTTYVVSGGDVTVGGSHLITVHLADQYGNVVTGKSEVLAAATTEALGEGTFSPFTESSTPGTYQATVSATVIGVKPITVTVGGAPVQPAGNTDASFISDGVTVDNGNTVFAVSDGEQVVGSGIHVVSVLLADRFGNPVTGQAAALSATTSLGATFTTFVEEEPGTYTADISATKAGDHLVTVRFGGDAVQAGGNTVARFVPGGVDWTNINSTYTVSEGDQSVGSGHHTITVHAADQFGNPTTADAAFLKALSAQPLGGGTATAFVERQIGADMVAGRGSMLRFAAAPANPDAPVEYVATITSTIAGVKKVVVNAPGYAVRGTGNLNAAFVAGAPSSVTSTIEFGTPTWNGSEWVTSVTVTLRDEFGNPIDTKLPIDLSASHGTFGELVYLGNGVYTTVHRSNSSGNITITVALEGKVVGQEVLTLPEREGVPTLPATGSEVPYALLIGGVALLIGGFVPFWLGKRRRREEEEAV